MAMENASSIEESEMMHNLITTIRNVSVINNSEVINDTINTLSESENIHNTSSSVKLTANDELQDNWPLFEAFVLTEIAMTALELILLMIAVVKIPRWRNNYRNQMLIQLSLARFIKRIIYYIEFREERHTGSTPTNLTVALFAVMAYIDFVIVIIVVFFIKHMYDSLIVVIVKINQGTLFKMLCCSWLSPLPVSGALAGIVSAKIVNEWLAYLLVCCIFRWPLILISTILYIVILYRVFTDKIRKFARSLTFTTFLICLIVNFYLFTKDVIQLWCFKSFITVLINYVSGFLLNLFILCFYLILILENCRKIKLSTPVLDYSIDNEAK